jgi:anti-sigma regulatory factor (Ser/Thr protein kinase)
VLLRQEVSDGVEVLSVRGSVADEEAAPLVDAVQQALAARPRAVVLDLAQVSSLSDHARSALGSLPPLLDGCALASMVVCPPAHTPDINGWLLASDRGAALAKVERRLLPRTRIDVEHSDQGPAMARAAVARCVEQLGLDAVRDDVLLLVSEMVTNAVRYAAPPVRLEISAGREDVVVAVCDGSPQAPARREPGEEAEGGRGMLLVDLLTDDHGVRSDPPGKAVWARLRRNGSGL